MKERSEYASTTPPTCLRSLGRKQLGAGNRTIAAVPDIILLERDDLLREVQKLKIGVKSASHETKVEVDDLKAHLLLFLQHLLMQLTELLLHEH